ncbi:MAG: hypothetical protein AAF809_09995 [Bacteroidota bacterium]
MLRFPALALVAALALFAGCDATDVTSGDPTTITPLPSSAGTITPGDLADAPNADSLFQIVVVDERGAPVPDLLVMVRSDLDLDLTATDRFEDGVPNFEAGPVFASPADSDTPAVIQYTLEQAGLVRLFLKTAAGVFLAEFFTAEQEPGTYTAAIPFQLYDPANPDALVTPGGVYFVEVDVDGAKADVPAVFTECPFLRDLPEVWGWLGTTDAGGTVLVDDRARFPSTYTNFPVLELRDAAGTYGGTFTFEVPVTIVVKDRDGNEATYQTTIDPNAVNFFEAVWNP